MQPCSQHRRGGAAQRAWRCVHSGAPVQHQQGALWFCRPPATAQRFVQRHLVLPLRQLRAGQRLLRGKQLALGVEHVQALFQQAVTRGEVVESDAQQMIEDLRRQLADGTTSQISSGLAGLLNKVPGVNIAYKAPDAPAQSEEDATSAAQKAP